MSFNWIDNNSCLYTQLTKQHWAVRARGADSYSTNHVYLHMPNAFGFWQTRLHLCYETLKRVSNFSELA